MKRIKIRWAACSLLMVGLLWPQTGRAQDLLKEFEGKVTTFTLDNGLRFLVIERHEAPVVSFFTYADVGSVNEVKGITGLAHIFEHMAFKGTKTLGTKDYEAEQAAMKDVDEAYEQLKLERHKGARADPARIEALESAFDDAKKAAQAYVENNEFAEVVQRAGGVGMNASTNSDATRYFYSLPANKVELWFSLESDRFLNPVLREFYVERDVVMEERRMRTESTPTGRLLEEFVAAAFKAHPYGEPVVGHMSDLESVTRAEAKAFFKKYYGPSNLTMAIAGDVEPARMKALAQEYFGRLPATPKPEAVETVEPEQVGEHRVIIHETSQPFLVMGWHKGSINDPDNVVYDVLSDILSSGRTSRMYKQLVEEKQVALTAAGFSGFPGVKYPNLFVVFGIPNRGHSPEELEGDIDSLIEDIKQNGVTEEELERAKTRARANLIRSLGSNTGLASQLSFYEVVTGDWRNLFRELDDLDAVTTDDVKRVANATFRVNNRTVGMIKTQEDTTASH